MKISLIFLLLSLISSLCYGTNLDYLDQLSEEALKQYLKELSHGTNAQSIEDFVENIRDITTDNNKVLNLVLKLWEKKKIGRNKWKQFAKFIRYIVLFDKKYKSEAEVKERFSYFMKNLKKISKNQKKSNLYGLTKFSDLSEKEFSQTYGGLKLGEMTRNRMKTKSIEDLHFLKSNGFNSTSIPRNYDIRKLNCTPPIKDQGGCGACWAFTTAAVAEINHCLKTGSTYDLSEQELISCFNSNYTPVEESPCSGGNPYLGLDYINDKGITTSLFFPYIGDKNMRQPAECRQDGQRFHFLRPPIGNQTRISEDLLPLYVYKNGAYGVAICNALLQNVNYHGGIIMKTQVVQEPKYDDCLDHAVTVVGFGEEDGVEFWIIRNSWGSDWGEAGYFRLERGKELLNFCVYDYTY